MSNASKASILMSVGAITISTMSMITQNRAPALTLVVAVVVVLFTALVIRKK